MAESAVPLKLTGERTLPGIPRENYWFQRHVIAYEFAREHVRGGLVLDIGCGEGYGSQILSHAAREVIGIDIAPDVIEHARNKYSSPNLRFLLMDVTDLGIESGSADAVVSLQVIEHIEREESYLKEVARVLRSGGIAIISTPNRTTISPGREKPINPFHFREYTPEELSKRLESFFEVVGLFGIFHSGWLRLNDRLKIIDFVKVYEMSRLNPRFWLHRLLTPAVRSSHFRVEKNDLDKCLDIVAVCRKDGTDKR